MGSPIRDFSVSSLIRGIENKLSVVSFFFDKKSESKILCYIVVGAVDDFKILVKNLTQRI